MHRDHSAGEKEVLRRLGMRGDGDCPYGKPEGREVAGGAPVISLCENRGGLEVLQACFDTHQDEVHRQDFPGEFTPAYIWATVCWGRSASTSAAMRASIATASTGNAPVADSPDNITQSVPSSIALDTSVASARVGSR